MQAIAIILSKASLGSVTPQLVLILRPILTSFVEASGTLDKNSSGPLTINNNISDFNKVNTVPLLHLRVLHIHFTSTFDVCCRLVHLKLQQKFGNRVLARLEDFVPVIDVVD